MFEDKVDRPSLLSLEDLITLRFETSEALGDWREIPDLRKAGGYIAEASSAWVRYRDSTVYKRILPLLPPIKGEYSDWDVIYCWNASALSALGQYDEGYAVIEEGLSRCKRTVALLCTLGDIKSDQNRIEGFGWWMQACMLGTSNWSPYLKLSVAADEVGRRDLSLRLVAATDLLVSGMPRFDADIDARLRDLARSDIHRMQTALGTFSAYMDPFLPSPTSLQTSEIGARIKARMRLLQRKPE